jgi:TonB-linked SusC/RagA family outer membrane protein
MIYNGYNNEWYLTLLAQADYKKSIKDVHNIGVSFVYEARSSAARYAAIRKYFDFFTNDQIDYATETNATSTGNEWQRRNMSFAGKVNYDYKGRYLIEFASRYDGSYRYHPDKRWTFFPIISGGWRISDESFMSRTSNVLSNLKIRASYGKTGEDVGEPFQYVPGFTTGGGWWEFTDGTTTLGLNTPAIVNERLSWVTSEVMDFGADFSFFNDRLSFTFDWYQKDKSGMLAYRNVSLPNTYGGTFPQENLNSLRLRGYDLSIEHNNKIGDINYRISGNFNYARWKYTRVEQGKYINSYSEYMSNPINRWQGSVWNWRVIGRYQTEEEIANGTLFTSTKLRNLLPGDFIYEDVNGDNFIDGNDLRPNFHDATPKINYGLSLSASYKGFDVNVLFQGAALFSKRIGVVYGTMFWGNANIPAYFKDRWHRADPYDPNSEWIPGKWPAMRTTDQASSVYYDSDVWRKDCTYLRIKNIAIGYTIPQQYIQKVGFNNLRVFFDASNVYTWSNEYVKMFDPERVAGDAEASWNYPLMKAFNFGISLNF